MSPAEGPFPRRDVGMLAGGQLVSELGARITRDGMPMLLVLTLGATPAQMGVLAICGSVPGLAATFFAGAAVDRVRRRRLMIGTDLARFAIIGSVPVAALLGALTYTHLCLVAALAAVASTIFEIAALAYVPTLVESKHLVKANTWLASVAEIAEVLGSALAGLLVQVLTGPIAMGVDAISYLGSIGSLALIRRREPEVPARAADEPAARVGLGDGLRLLRRDPVLRALAGSGSIARFSGGFLEMGYTLYVIRELEMTPVTLGLLISAGGLGGFVGALAAGPVLARVGIGKSIVAASVISTMTLTMMLLPGPRSALAFVALLAAQIVGDFAQAIARIGQVTLRQIRVPPNVMGRVNAAMTFVIGVAGPFGALAGGLAGDAIGLRSALFVAAGIRGIASAWLLFSPVRASGDLALASADAPASSSS